jgi:hypothetical protein
MLLNDNTAYVLSLGTVWPSLSGTRAVETFELAKSWLALRRVPLDKVELRGVLIITSQYHRKHLPAIVC